MRVKLGIVVVIQAALVVGLSLAVGRKWVPLGIPGEWEWLRVPYAPNWLGVVLAGLAVTAYAGLAALGVRSLRTTQSRRLEVAWLAGLLAAAIGVQVMIPVGAPEGYGLAKWAAVNYLPGSTGYFKIARQHAARDPWQFLAEYPEWIKSQDSLHIGTHPPGLIVVQCILLNVMDHHPAIVDFLIAGMPSTVETAFRIFSEGDPRPLTRAERAALYATALLTLLACAGTVVPLYVLARVALPAPAGWAAAAFWPLASAANLFQPSADTSYPLLSTSALALASWAARLAEAQRPHRFAGISSSMLAGALMALGMVCTLAFLPVGLIVALVILFRPSLSWTVKAGLITTTGVGFMLVLMVLCAIARVDPVTIASWNLHHHARFYDEYPRTYWYWLAANPIEVAIALGLPSVAWCLIGLLHVRSVPASVWATLGVVILVNLIGRNMGEVARLWMLFMPPLLVAAGSGFHELGAGPRTLAISIALLGVQTLVLEAFIQVVYPV